MISLVMLGYTIGLGSNLEKHERSRSIYIPCFNLKGMLVLDAGILTRRDFFCLTQKKAVLIWKVIKTAPVKIPTANALNKNSVSTRNQALPRLQFRSPASKLSRISYRSQSFQSSTLQSLNKTGPAGAGGVGGWRDYLNPRSM